jgi:hypothetical protein
VTSARFLAGLLALVVLAAAAVAAVPQTRTAALRQVRLSTGEIAPSYTELYFQPLGYLPRKVAAGSAQRLEFFVFPHGTVRQEERGVVLFSSSGRTRTVAAFSVKAENRTPQAFRAAYRAPAQGRAFTITVMLLPTRLTVFMNGISVVS